MPAPMVVIVLPVPTADTVSPVDFAVATVALAPSNSPPAAPRAYAWAVGAPPLTSRLAIKSKDLPVMLAFSPTSACTLAPELAVATEAPTAPAPILIPMASALVLARLVARTSTSPVASTSARSPISAVTFDVTSAVATDPEPATTPAEPARLQALATESSVADTSTLSAPEWTPAPSSAEVDPSNLATATEAPIAATPAVAPQVSVLALRSVVALTVSFAASITSTLPPR